MYFKTRLPRLMLNSRLNLYVPPQIQDTNGTLVATVIPWLIFLLFFLFFWAEVRLFPLHKTCEIFCNILQLYKNRWANTTSSPMVSQLPSILLAIACTINIILSKIANVFQIGHLRIARTPVSKPGLVQSKSHNRGRTPKLACSAGVFFGHGNVLLAKALVETRKEGRKWGESKGAGIFTPLNLSPS